MVKAGAGTDSAIDSLKPYLDKGDIIIDGGNTFFQDTIRRNRELSAEGFNFIGTGVSGGEEGALKGPSIMPGGQKEAYELVAPILSRLLLVLKTVSRVSPISVLTVLVTMSKWFTTASNMAICS
jgi:6-phosphogluconate dehydrogenase